MIFLSDLAILWILAGIAVVIIWFQWKYGKPLYQYVCEYQYTRFGDQGQYFTEILKARPNNNLEKISNNSKTTPSPKSTHQAQLASENLEEVSKILEVHVDSKTITANTPTPKKLVFIFFSGNPGYIRFYDRFLQHLSDIYQGQHEILGIGQAGQSLHESEYHRYFTLQEQVDHKELFFNSLIAQPEYKNADFVFIGHSFGCYSALKLLTRIDASRVKQTIMIHPAIDRLSETPNGIDKRYLRKYDKYFKFALRILESITPLWILRIISLWIFNKDKYPSNEDVADCAETLACWLRYDTAYSFIKLSHFQFSEIRELSEEEILSVAEKLTVFYAVKDDWTPDVFKKNFKDQFGHRVRCLEDNLGMGHVFVAGGSLVMAKTIQSLLEGKI